MSKYTKLNSGMSAYTNAMRRADAAILRGLKKDAAYWMKIADHAHRINFRYSEAEDQYERIKRALEERRLAAKQ